MLRKVMLAVALAAVAAPALADTKVVVNVAGVDEKAAHAIIYHAAQRACQAELSEETELVRFFARPICLDDTIARAEAKYQAMRALASR